MHLGRRRPRVAQARPARVLVAAALAVALVVSGAVLATAAEASAAAESGGVKYKYRTYSQLDIADMPAEYAAGVQWGVTCSGKVKILRISMRYGAFRPGSKTVWFLTAAELAGLNFPAPTEPSVKQAGSSIKVKGKTLASLNVIEVLLGVLPVGKVAAKVATKLTGKNMVKLAKKARSDFKHSLRAFLQKRLGMSKQSARWTAGEFVDKTLGSDSKLAKRLRSAVKSGTTAAAKRGAVERLLSSRFVNVAFRWFAFDQTLKLKTNGTSKLVKSPRAAPGKRKDVRYAFSCPKKKPTKPKSPRPPGPPGFSPGETRLAVG